VKWFIESGRLNREPEGPGLHVFRSLGWGAFAGLVGGFVSSPVMLATGVLPKIAGLETPFSILRGLLLHSSRTDTLEGYSPTHEPQLMSFAVSARWELPPRLFGSSRWVWEFCCLFCLGSGRSRTRREGRDENVGAILIARKPHDSARSHVTRGTAEEISAAVELCPRSRISPADSLK
jgi:hypothetical protein